MTHVLDSHAPPGHVPDPDGPRRPWTVLALMLLAQFMVVLDVSVVNVALPSIGRSLQFGAGDYQWVVSAYVLMSGSLLLLGGRIADLFNRRTVFLTGLGAFTLASLVSGLAASPELLILTRAVQGAGAALLTPAALSILMTTYHGRQRAAALGVWGTIASTGIAAGVLCGGALTSGLGWRAVFFVNVPIGVVVAGLATRAVEHGTAASISWRRLDLPGAAALVSGLVVLVLGIERTRSTGWVSAGTLAAFATAAALLAAFAVRERRTDDPLVPPHTWRVRSLVSSAIVMAGVTGAVVGAIFLTSLYLQRVAGASPVVAGLEFLPLAGAITGSAALAGHLLGRIGPRVMIAGGVVVMAAGALLLAAAAPTTSYAVILPGLLVLGAGVGPMFVAISVAAMSDVPPQHAGLAGGLLMTGHEVGAALGVSVLATIAGDLTTTAGVVAGYPRALDGVAVIAAGLLLVALTRIPRRISAAAAAHGGMHH